MTMLDDDTLTRLFAEAADAFDAPALGPDAIIQAARKPTATPIDPDAHEATHNDGEALPLDVTRRQRTVRLVQAHRVLSAAAAILLLFVAVGLGTYVTHSTPNQGTTSAARSLHRTPPLSGASHTGSSFGVSGGGTGSGAAASGTAGVPTVAGPVNGGATTGTGSSAPAASPAPASAATAPGAKTSSPLPSTVGQSARIEQTGTLNLSVHKGALTKTMDELTLLAGSFGGFVASSQTESVTGSSAAPNGSITIEVPVASFGDLLSRAQQLGKASDVTTKANDVTGQYVDLQSRITALQDSRQQYLTILAKATSIGDVLSVQSQLDNIQSQLEQLQGQLQVLTNETDYSIVTLLVSEGRPVVHPRPAPHPATGVRKAWDDSVHGFAVGVDDVIRLAGPVLFVLLCGAVLIVGGRVGWRRWQRHRL